jgi:hypothetical protein
MASLSFAVETAGVVLAASGLLCAVADTGMTLATAIANTIKEQ